MLKKWVYLAIRNAIDLGRLGLRVIFYPSLVGRQIQLNDETAFIRSLKLFFAAISTYLIVASIVSYFLVDDTYLKYVSNEIIFTSRELISIAFQAALFYVIYRFVFRRSTAFLNIVHVWLYIFIASFVLNMIFIPHTHFVLAPPLSAQAGQFFQAVGGPLGEHCNGNADARICRSWGHAYDISISVIKFLLGAGIEKDASNFHKYFMGVLYLFFASSVAIFFWILLVGTKIISKSLDMKWYLAMIVFTIVIVGNSALYHAFPVLGYLFSDTGYSRGTEFQQMLDVISRAKTQS